MSAHLDHMSNRLEPPHSDLRQQIDHSLQRASAQKHKLQTIDRKYSIINIVLGAIAAFVAGQSVVADKPLVGNWRVMTTFASVLTLGATVAAGVQKQIASPDLVAEVSQCVAELKALKIETLSPIYELEKVSEEYQKILTEFSKVDL
ncbi:MAG: hypothetical protein NW224_10355 [Leptolyngbyaceae cyanobacterium bins.302]|nr:hypothetical protein [Leptolyngbyaceae cyanobacterium bins.302]